MISRDYSLACDLVKAIKGEGRRMRGRMMGGEENEGKRTWKRSREKEERMSLRWWRGSGEWGTKNEKKQGRYIIPPARLRG